jgi:hypothetical protein
MVLMYWTEEKAKELWPWQFPDPCPYPRMVVVCPRATAAWRRWMAEWREVALAWRRLKVTARTESRKWH